MDLSIFSVVEYNKSLQYCCVCTSWLHAICRSDPFIVLILLHAHIQSPKMKLELVMRTNLTSMIISILCQSFKLKACDLILTAHLIHESSNMGVLV